MKTIYTDILTSISKGEKLLAVLIDPDKMLLEQVQGFIRKVNASKATHIFVGGSSVKKGQTHTIVSEIKKYTILPIILFPGDVSQISDKADALLFLSLISGRAPEYLIGIHVEAAAALHNSDLEVIPTGYLLIDGGHVTSVQRATGTKPMVVSNITKIVNTAKAGELLGMKLIYLEAGSGASQPVNQDVISAVKRRLDIPILVGGGIKCIEQLEKAYNAGADLVIIGTAFENDETFLESLKRVYN